MDIFRILTPVTYWLLIAMWTFILFFYIRRLRLKRVKSPLFITLIVILAIDAFRTLFESLYFGAWYTSLAGLLPMGIHDFLVRPEMVIIPKSLNVIAGALIITILLLHWLPNEERERTQQKKHVDELEMHVKERTEELMKSNEQLQVENTERKRAEEALKASNQQLQASEQQLRASNQQLRANEQQLRTEISERKKIEEEREKHVHDLEVFYKANIGREERMIELKKRIKELEEKVGEKS